MEMPKPASTGNGFPAWKFNAIGATIKGTITSDPNVVDRPKPNSTETEQQLVFEVHTDDTLSCANQEGETATGQDWTLWVKVRSQMYSALFDAVKAADANAHIEQGDTIVFKFAGLRDVGKPSKMKEFQAAFKKGEPAVSTEPQSVDSLL